MTLNEYNPPKKKGCCNWILVLIFVCLPYTTFSDNLNAANNQYPLYSRHNFKITMSAKLLLLTFLLFAIATPQSPPAPTNENSIAFLPPVLPCVAY